MSYATPARLIRVRKDHSCDYCGTQILKGEEVLGWTYYDQGQPPYHVRIHTGCDALARLLECDTGSEYWWTSDAPLRDTIDDLGGAVADAEGEDREWLLELLIRWTVQP